jgi:uncharacterized membrane protein YtjA (UPF0391 family)
MRLSRTAPHQLTKCREVLVTEDNPADGRPPRRLACLLLEYQAGKELADMLYYALVFLVVGLIAGALGIYGVAGVASQIAWILFLIGIVLLVIHLISGTRRPTI